MSDELPDVLRDVYRPLIVEMLREHEEWCAANPDAAAFLAALPNGGWRTGTLAGLDPEPPINGENSR